MLIKNTEKSYKQSYKHFRMENVLITQKESLTYNYMCGKQKIFHIL